MKTLFIDTHSEKLGIAIIDDNDIFEEIKEGNRSHSEIAIPTLQSVLKKASCELKDIDEIIVVNGPGSFTGVRIGVTIAKTIAYSLNIPIKTVTSLEAFGVSADKEYDVVTVRDPKGVYCALYNGVTFSDYEYRKNNEFDEFINKNNYRVCSNTKIDLIKLINYLKTREFTNPHSVNPVYIKEILQ